jgi:type VI secretion system protein ImpK
MDRINELTRDCFGAIHQLREAGDALPAGAAAVHAQLVGFIETLRERARERGLPERDAEDVAYALAALADEVALSRSEEIRSHWYGRPLQMHFFGENVAGEGFFRRLEALRGDPRRSEALRVYYLCLLFGFQGKYAMSGGEPELLRLQAALRAELDRTIERPDGLSPDGLPPDEGPRLRREGRLPLWLGLGALAAAMTVYIGLRVVLDQKSKAVGAEVVAGGQR